MKTSISLCLAFIFSILCATSRLSAEDKKGQESLEKAIEAKISAESLDDYTQVIKLCEKALADGLDQDGTSLAKQLLSSTLKVRGESYVKALMSNPPTNPNQLKQWDTIKQLALSDLEKAVEHDPNLAEVYMMIGKLQTLPGGDREKGVKAIDQFLKLSRKEDKKEIANAYALRAELQKDVEKKLADFNEAVKADPKNADVLRDRAFHFLTQNKIKEALDDLDASLKIEPDHPGALQAKGAILAEQKNFDEALKALDKSIDLEPRSPLAYIHRARIHIFLNNNKEAVNDLDKALLLQANNISALLMRASLLSDLKRPEKAMTDIEAILKLQPKNETALKMKAMIYAQMNKLDEAIGEMEKLLKSTPNQIDLLMQLALLHGFKKDLAKEVEYYTSAIKADPKLWAAYRGRGDAYLTHGKHAEALADLNKAAELQPKDPGILNNLAWLLATSPDEKIRNGNRAIVLATEACELTEHKQGHILSTLAAAYAETGDFESALKWSEKAVELGDEKVKENLKKELESYKVKKPWREQLTGKETDGEAGVKPEAKEDPAKSESSQPDASKKDQPKSDQSKSEKK